MANIGKKKRYIKPESVKRLENFAFKQIKKSNPNFPYPVKPKYRDDTTNELTRCVIDSINLTGFQAERINTTGNLIENNGKQKWVKGSSTKGSADISAIIKGKSVKIEIKCRATGDYKQSHYQKIYQKQVEKAGGIYLIIRDFTQFYRWYGKFLNSIKNE